MRRHGDQGPEPMRWQNAGVAALVLVALALVVLALTRDTSAVVSDPGAAAGSGLGATEEPSGSGVGTQAPGASPTAQPSTDAGSTVPTVKDLVKFDFTRGAGLPPAARTYDNESVGEPMAIQQGALQHGVPAGPVAVSSLETKLADDVRKVGARVRFIGDDPGQVVLVAWQSSFVDARRAGSPLPASGLRLTVSHDGWRLTVAPGDQAIASGTFAPVSGTANISVVRDGDRAWVLDPYGQVTPVSDPRIADLAGPWACWQLVEDRTVQVPAAIEAITAG